MKCILIDKNEDKFHNKKETVRKLSVFVDLCDNDVGEQKRTKEAKHEKYTRELPSTW